MSVVLPTPPLQTTGTKANQNIAYYSGGGGGGGSTINVVASSLTVSSILGGGPGQSLEFPNGFQLPVGASMQLGGGGAPTSGDIQFTNSNGQLVGVSTINGAAYPPAGGGGAPISTIISGGATIGSTAQNLVPAGPTLSTGKYYLFTCTLDSASNNVIGAPNAGDHAALVLPDASIPLTIDLSQLAAQKAKGQPLGLSVSAPFIAGAGAFQLSAYCNAASGASTFLGATSPGWLIPLN